VIGVDTNVLARTFVAEVDADAATERQRRAARDLIESSRCSTTCWPIPDSRQKTDQPWSRRWPVYAADSTSPMPCTMPAAVVARRWRRLRIAAFSGAAASSICRHACLYRQVPERELGPLWLNQLGGRRRRPLLVFLEGDPSGILPVEPAIGAAGEEEPRRLGW